MGMPAFLPPQQMPYMQYTPPYQQVQAMPFQQYVQQGPQFMPGPPVPPQAQPSIALPVQPGATGVVRPKRKKKKQTQNQRPTQAPPQLRSSQ
jgi:hypothetical protein